MTCKHCGKPILKRNNDDGIIWVHRDSLDPECLFPRMIDSSEGAYTVTAEPG